MKIEQRQEKECAVCSKLTKYICMDCATDRGKFLSLCSDFQCIRSHSQQHQNVQRGVREKNV